MKTCEHGVTRKKRCLECYLNRELGAAIDAKSRRELVNKLRDHARSLEPIAKKLLATHARKA